MADMLKSLLQEPFVWGLIIGIAVAIFLWIRGIIKQAGQKKEIKKLKGSLYTKMEIDAKGHKTREDELEKLRKQNENLRITVKSLQQKPNRAEIRQLHVFDKAIHAMLARAPGFAATWEMVLKESEDEIEKSETGITAFMRKVFVPQRKLPSEEDETKLIDYEVEDKDT